MPQPLRPQPDETQDPGGGADGQDQPAPSRLLDPTCGNVRLVVGARSGGCRRPGDPSSAGQTMPLPLPPPAAAYLGVTASAGLAASPTSEAATRAADVNHVTTRRRATTDMPCPTAPIQARPPHALMGDRRGRADRRPNRMNYTLPGLALSGTAWPVERERMGDSNRTSLAGST